MPMKTITNREADCIENLISQMSIEEKAGQLNQIPMFDDGEQACRMAREGLVGSVVLAYTPLAGSEQRRSYEEHRKNIQEAAVHKSRLGIPVLFGRDVIHGHKTVFPVPLGLSAAFDESLVEKAASIAAAEAARDGIHWTFAPMADVSRDSRWGRVVEGFGEDTFLTSRMTRASVRGFQKNGIAACVKHFAGYGAVEGGRDYGNAEITETTLREVYLPPFTAAVDEGVMTVMTSFNTIGGESLTASYRLITQLLKDELGFRGFVVSDWDAVAQLINQGIAADRKQAALLAFNAGVDMDMVSGCFVEFLPSLIKSGDVSAKRLDDALRRVLGVKLKLGLLNGNNPEPAPFISIPKKHALAAKECAEASFVLLKNDNELLPLAKCEHKIALAGPYADDRRNQLGCWTLDGHEADTVTLAQGLENVNASAELFMPQPAAFGAAVQEADYVIAAIGEHWDASGESRGSSGITVPQEHIDLLKKLYAINKNIIVILSSGRALVLEELLPFCKSLLLSWHGGTMAGEALAEMIYGQTAPAGKLPLTFPRSSAQMPMYYNQLRAGRNIDDYYGKAEFPGYRDIPGSPRFPFGYGLSYTNFAYDELKAEISSGTSADSHAGQILTVSAVCENTGSRCGSDVAQCYISLRGGNRARSCRELIGYKKVTLQAGQSEIVRFTHAVPPGTFDCRVYVGGDSVSAKEAVVRSLSE